jgi:hypothetical protein
MPLYDSACIRRAYSSKMMYLGSTVIGGGGGRDGAKPMGISHPRSSRRRRVYASISKIDGNQDGSGSGSMDGARSASCHKWHV